MLPEKAKVKKTSLPDQNVRNTEHDISDFEEIKQAAAKTAAYFLGIKAMNLSDYLAEGGALTDEVDS